MRERQKLTAGMYVKMSNDTTLNIYDTKGDLVKNDELENYFDNEVYQALLYFFAGIGFGYLLFNVIL